MACAFSNDTVMDILRLQIEQHKAAAKVGNTRPTLLSKSDFMDSLLNYNFANAGITGQLTLSEASDIADEYFGSYVKLFTEVGKGKLGKAWRTINNAMTAANDARLLSAAEMAAIQRMVDRAFLLDNSARDREVEKIADFIKRDYAAYNHEKLRAATFLNKLLSVRFIVSAALSNATQVAKLKGIEGIKQLRNGKVDERITGMATRIATNNLADVFAGGLPAQTAMETELGKNNTLASRPEEFDINNDGWWLTRLMASTARVTALTSARLNNSIDSFGVSYTTEKHLYSVLLRRTREDWKAAGKKMDNKAINAEVYKKMYPMEGVPFNSAYNRAVEMWQGAGYMITQSGSNTDTRINENSPKFKRSVLEKQREGRDQSAVALAHRLALIDFFKQPMSHKGQGRISGFDLFDKSMGGGIATLSAFFGSVIHSAVRTSAGWFGVPESKADWFADAVQLNAVGFINGANAFLEQSLELTPLGFVKAGLMKASQGTATPDNEEYAAMRTQQVANNAIYGTVMSALLFGLIKVINEFLCKDDGSEISFQDAKEGKGFAICGHKLPVYLLGMQGPMVGIWNLMANGQNKATIESLSGFSSLIGFRFDEKGMKEAALKYFTAKNAYEKEAAIRELQQSAADIMAQNTLGVLPLPFRLTNEATHLFSIDSQVKPTIESFPEFMKWSYFQVLGIKDAMLDAEGNNPVYDYRGRTVVNNWQKYSVNDGIKYDQVDDYLNKVGLDYRLLYNGPYRTLYSSSKWIDTDKQPRYPTSDEYSKNLLATGKLFDEYMTTNLEKLQQQEPEVAKRYIEQELKDLEDISKDAMEDVEPEKYEDYMRRNMKQRARETIRKKSNKLYEKKIKKQKEEMY